MASMLGEEDLWSNNWVSAKQQESIYYERNKSKYRHLLPCLLYTTI